MEEDLTNKAKNLPVQDPLASLAGPEGEIGPNRYMTMKLPPSRGVAARTS